MTQDALRFVFLGLSLTSSWGNGHATTYRGLVRELCEQGHEVVFLERDMPWYASNRDMPHPPFGRAYLYQSLDELRDGYTQTVRQADIVIVGSYVPDGVTVGGWVLDTAQGVTAFYDIDTPVTLAKLGRGDYEYITPALIPRYDLYLSFSGGPTLTRLEQEYGSPAARPLYCSVDPALYYPDTNTAPLYDLGYMGTYSDDRQPPLDRLLVEPARQWAAGRFAVAGPQYPADIVWPSNVQRIEHLRPAEHRAFYAAQRVTLNITRRDMIEAGYSPSVRLFEAAACGTPILSDWWPGLDTFFTPDREILIAHTPADALHALRELDADALADLGDRAHQRVLSCHTAAHRARELAAYAREAMNKTTHRR